MYKVKDAFNKDSIDTYMYAYIASKYIAYSLKISKYVTLISLYLNREYSNSGKILVPIVHMNMY